MGAIILMAVLLVVVPALVSWVQQNARMAVKDAQNTTAFNLAQAAVDRGYWKAKSSTGTIAQALAGMLIPGYAFDATYNDVPGGTYRIRITSAANSSIQILGEGRDASNRQTRAIAAVYQNRTIYSPLLTQGDVNYDKGMCIYWGPLMSQGSINLDNTTAQWYWPRKFARGDVVGVAGYPRDTTWPLPPNTDNVEWWANYQYVPELPILDFATLRSSAAATNTLNVYGCVKSSQYTDPATGNILSGAAPWAGTGSCPAHSSLLGGSCPGTAGAGSGCHFGASFNHPDGARYAAQPYVWYWDGDLVLTGHGGSAPGHLDAGLWGTVIVRGNLTIDAGGDYNYTNNVPVDAWMDQNKLLINTYDTVATNEYPADDGLHKTLPTWNFGSSSFCQPGQSCGWVNTVGIRGFVYVGGNLIIKSFMDFNGAIWVNGIVSASCPSSDPSCTSHFCGVFYDDQLSVPTLNVVLVRMSWQEVPPSPAPWL
jgi:hypothetical protein